MILGMKFPASLILTSRNGNCCIRSRVCLNVSTIFRFVRKFLISKIFNTLSKALCSYHFNLPDLSIENTLCSIYVFKMCASTSDQLSFSGKNCQNSQNKFSPQMLNRVMVLTHILHQPTWYTIFHNDKWYGFNSLGKK